jgi:uncharacterized protein
MIKQEIKDKIDFFSNSIRQRLGDNIRRIVLYGSRARGDYWEGSDYDFLVVVAHKDKQVRDIIGNVEVEFMNSYDELAASLLYDENEWERKKKFPLGINVEREGIVL